MTAIVLLSGGQDSATCLAVAMHDHKHVHCVCVDYGQRHRIEIEFSQTLARIAGASFQCLDVSVVKQVTNSAMVHDNQPIKTLDNGLPSTFVPGRNALFLTLAAMVAVQNQCLDIYTGVCQTDYSGYPDCRESFIMSQQTTLREAMAVDVVIHAPLMHLSKADTVQRMVQLGCLDWYAYTHTCYYGERPACGKCPSCVLRKKGFLEAGYSDPIQYKD